jgi:histone-lysine N-methyltransferase SETMAR
MEFITEGANLNKHCYKEILCCLCNSVWKKYPELRRRKKWLLLHNTIPAHHSLLIEEELAKQQGTVMPHPPYSPDLTPCDLFFFLHL